MNLDFKCLKCGCEEYYVRTAILPERDTGIKIEMGTYYLKVCAGCGYTEMYSAKILDCDLKKEKKKAKENKLEPKTESNS